LGAKSFERSTTIPTLGLVLDGAVFPPPRPDAFSPFCTDALSVEPWPFGPATGTQVLAWLAGAFAHRPLVGLTNRPLRDSDGMPVRGFSPRGSGVALVSTRGLSREDLQGVVRHEVGHAFGMDHCECWDCALSPRPHPLSVHDRASSLCPVCQGRWDALWPGGNP
jgi:hypothetical protein